ncbi:MAG: putative chromosome-partitioning protein ParB [Firmicutes bacterium ADurb.Bin506]|jgi:ParB family chromosome partitioning protein|nr:MAG: putative chromosome-partitioning protein ParB [Firmicutes bacterium ADurb.Bin506]
MAARPRALGRGLSAIFENDNAVADKADISTMELKLDELSPNPYQPRRSFDEAALNELAESVKAHGVIQPVVVRRVPGGGYQIIAGERRWRAARLAGLTTIPAVIKKMDDAAMMQVALIENLQRQDLNPIEEATAYRRLMDEFRMTQEDVSAAVGRSRPAVANSVRLLNLPSSVQEHLAEGRLSVGHARCLLTIENPEIQARLADHIVEAGLNVRQAEQVARDISSNVSRETKRAESDGDGDPDVALLIGRLSERLGTKVKLTGSPSRGAIHIDFYAAEDLDRILDIILGAGDAVRP